MNDADRLDAVCAGHLAGTLFRVAEVLGLTWRQLRKLPIQQVMMLLKARA